MKGKGRVPAKAGKGKPPVKRAASAPAISEKPKAPEYERNESGLWSAFFDTDEMSEYVTATNKILAAIKRGDKEVALPTEFLRHAISNIINFRDPLIVAAWNRS